MQVLTPPIHRGPLSPLPLQGHDNDIRCLAMHPNRTTVATGQMAQGLDAEGDGVGDVPYACVWDTTDVTATIRKIPITSDGEPAGFIVALAFSADGTLLIIVTGDTKHTLYIYDLAAKAFLYQAPGYQGTPPSVRMGLFSEGDEEVVPRGR